MLPGKIFGALLITLSLSACTLFKKPAAPDYSTSLYISSTAHKDSTSTAIPAGNSHKPALSRSDSLLKTKYAGYLQVPADSIHNLKLYRFIDEWLNTPYQWGGTTKRGIDCSALMQRLLAEVYDIYIPRTSYQQYFTDNVERFARWESLAEGDLIFFKTIPGNPITHVGLYLGNGRFVNSASRGVTIESLRKPYWAARYVASGRLIVNKSRRVAKN
ncbi:C40 family peptidase [Niabella sp.]|uniref:C40 family peptidase n=1 Tax=Niabella sp. TaxID=1962976 RepID=UPI0026364F38|nr:C40 family peptidase [Niabella sp.]